MLFVYSTQLEELDIHYNLDEISRVLWGEMSWFTIFADVSGRKHPGMKCFWYETSWNPLFQVLVFEGCQGEIINLLIMRKCRMGCYLCCIVYNFEFSFFRALWMKLSDRHICVQQGFEMHVYGL